MCSTRKPLLKLLTGVSLFAAAGICLGTVQALADPLVVTGHQELISPLASFLDDPLLTPNTLYPFRDAYGYAPSGYTQTHAVLTVLRTRLRQVRLGGDPSGENFAIDIRLYNDIGERRSFYNLDWNGLISLPGRLALYDSQKRYVCDLLERIGGSRTTISANDWSDVLASGYVGKTLDLRLPYPSYKVLPPGSYYLQVIYLPRLVSYPSQSNSSIFNYDERTELFRSNAVPITVVDQAEVKTPKPAPVL